MSRWTEEEVNIAIKMFKNNQSFDDISVKIERTPLSIRTKLRNMGYSRHDYKYKLGDIVNGLLIMKRVRYTDKNLKAYEVQSLTYPNAENYIVSENHLNNGKGCAYKANQRICEENSLYSIVRIRPYLVNIEESKKMSRNHSKPVLFKCPECGKVEKTKPSTFINRTHPCRICGTGYFPELLFSSINEYYTLGFLAQQTLPNSKMRFDFVNYKNKIIVETHGIQHYENNEFLNSKRTKESDANKRKYCKENGYTLIELDCRESSFEFIISKINNDIRLPNIYKNDERHILKIMEQNKRYPVKEIISLYVEEGFSTYEIGAKFKITNTTIGNILKRHNVKLRKGGKVPDNRKRVRCVNTGEEFESTVKASEWCGLKYGTTIGYVCNGGRNYAGRHPITGEKLHWEYVD